MLSNNALANKIKELKGTGSFQFMSDQTNGELSKGYFSTLVNGDSRTKSPIKPGPDKLKIIADAYPLKTSYSELMRLAGYGDNDINSDSPDGLTDSQRKVAYFIDPNATDEEIEQIKKLVEIAKLSKRRL